MAKILKTDKQSEALSVINGNIKLIAQINDIVPKKDLEGQLVYTVDNDKLRLLIKTEQILPLFTSIRKIMVSEVNNLANEYFINLDSDDKKILNGEVMHTGNSYE